MSDEPKGNARSSGYERNADDWYVEPASAVDALIAAEGFDGYVWDPACGGGNIPRRAIAAGLVAQGTDLRDRGYGRQYDFLGPRLPAVMPNMHIITNPPFNLAVEFAQRALLEVSGKVAILQRLAWLEGKKRRTFFMESGLSHVWVHSSRISMPPGGSDIPAKGGSVAFAWFVWRRDGKPTTLGFLP